MPDAVEFLGHAKTKLGLGQYHRHVMLCVGPRCCTLEEGEAAYETLKDHIKDRGLFGAHLCRCGDDLRIVNAVAAIVTIPNAGNAELSGNGRVRRIN